MIDKIKKNKTIILFLTILFVVLVYCSFQIFIISDDLPYSLLHRGSERVDSIRDIISNQLADYKYTNARIFIHSIVQFLLMFGKDLWGILNPLMIIISICLLTYIICIIYKDKKINKKFIVLFFTSCFLLLYNYKYLIYWIAGSVNYVWLFNLMLLFIIYDLKIGLVNKKISILICLIGSILHESFSIFIIIYIIFSMLISNFIKKDFKKYYKIYIMCLIFSIVGLLFIMMAPSTITRMNSSLEWNDKNIIDKFLIAIPSISKTSFYLYDIYNLIPILFLGSIIYNIIRNRIKFSKILLLILCIITFMMIFVSNGWLCFVFSICLLIIQVYILYKNKDYKLICVLLGSYAIIYSLFLTIEHISLRPNYYFNLIISIFIIYNYLDCKINIVINRIFRVLVVIVTFLCLGIEIHIYSYIGSVNEDRINNISEVRENDSKILELKKIEEPYGRFHMDANSPSGNDYWAIKYFLDYYELDDDVLVKLVLK